MPVGTREMQPLSPGRTTLSPRMTTFSALYKAPFAPGGSHAIDEALAQRLLAVALSSGGDYADLFFEYRAAGGFVFDEGILKTASRGVVDGRRRARAAGRRDRLRLRRAARLGRDEAGGRDRRADRQRRPASPTPARLVARSLPRRYDVRRSRRSTSPALDKRALLERAVEGRPRRRRAGDQGRGEPVAEEIREILVATSEGRLARDTQPLLRFGVHVVAERTASGRRELERRRRPDDAGLLRRQMPGAPRREAARQAVTMLDAAEAPAGEMEVVLAPGDSGILLHEAVGHGLEADFNRKGTSNYTRPDRQAGRERALHRRRRRDAPAVARVDQRRRRGQRAAAQRPHRERQARRLHARPAQREHFKRDPTGNGRRESFGVGAAAAHDQHHPARRARTTRRRS